MAGNATHDAEDVRIALRIPRWLHEDVERCAGLSGWDLSKQIRYELAHLRGKAHQPCMPEPVQASFNNPTDGSPGRRKRRPRS